MLGGLLRCSAIRVTLYSSFVLLCALAWNDDEHAIVVEIARMSLISSGQEAIVNKVDQIVATPVTELPPAFGDVVKDGLAADVLNEPEMVTVGAWFDHISARNNFYDWHSDTRAFDLRENMPAQRNRVFQANFDEWAVDNKPVDATTAVEIAMRFLMGNASVAEKGWSNSFAVRTLIHLVGDLHQPLHVLHTLGGYCWYKDLLLERPPSYSCDTVVHRPFVGFQDHGGVRGVRTGKCWTWGLALSARLDTVGISSLHNVWDAAGHLLHETKQLPVTEPRPKLDAATREAVAAAIIARQRNLAHLAPLESVLDPEAWSAEAEQMVNEVYPEGLVTSLMHAAVEDGTFDPPVGYLANVRRLSETRIYLAGIRLGRILWQVLQNFEPNQPSLRRQVAAPVGQGVLRIEITQLNESYGGTNLRTAKSLQMAKSLERVLSE